MLTKLKERIKRAIRRIHKNTQTPGPPHRLPPGSLSPCDTAQPNPPQALIDLSEARRIRPLEMLLALHSRQQPGVLEYGNRNGAVPDCITSRRAHGFQARGALGGAAVAEFEACRSVAEVVAVGEGL